MHKFAVPAICLSLVLFISSALAGGQTVAAQTKAAAADTASQQGYVARKQGLETQFSAEVQQLATDAGTAAHDLTNGIPDYKSVGDSAVVLLNIGGKDYFELASVPDGVSATYRTNFDSEKLLDYQNESRQLVMKGVLMALGKGMTFLELRLIWCGPYHDSAKNEDVNRTSCSNAEIANNKYPTELCPPEIKGKDANHSRWATCTVDTVYTRDLNEAITNFSPDQAVSLQPAFALTEKQLLISVALLEEIKKSPAGFPTFVINDVELHEFLKGYDESTQTLSSNDQQTLWSASYKARSGWSSVRNYKFERYPAAENCRPYDTTKGIASISVTRPTFDPDLMVDNGIALDPPKVYDVYTLRQMLNQTASQISTLSGFNSASITAALTNFQGVTSNSSFLNAQATMFPTASTQTTVNNPNTTTQTVTPSSVNSSTTITATCPTGYAPSIGASNTVTCTAAAAGTPNQTTLTSTTTPAGTTTPAMGSTTVTANPLTQQTVTTAPSITATIPTAPASTAFAAPTNTGLSASDLLTDQVQLNAQITSLQLALQGALSDQYLVSANKSVGTRQQTTIGFNVGIDPPRRYKHALAEVRIWVFPAHQDDEISIVNLLPAAKTYNVAKITSSQKQFGAGVAVNPVNIGVAGGKAKNRLYIAKDTDTLAVRYNVDNLRPTVAQWPDRGAHWSGSAWYQNQVIPNTWPKGAKPIGRSPQEAIADVVPAGKAWQAVANACNEDPGPYLLPENPEDLSNPLVFGWQFRPVLGADYVQGGIRMVIAQLALPVGLGAQYAPRVFVQTRWRDYDEKKQVVGGVYPGTCSIQEETDAIQVVSPLKVHSVDVEDMTGGVLKVVAHGNFLSNSLSVLSGPNTLTPITFDGKQIQFFGNAESLLATDDLNLEAEDGELTQVAMRPISPDKDDPNECGLTRSYLHATPRPDGSSIVEAVIESGKRFKLTKDGEKNDGEPKPLFLIGTQVYGLHETPFLEPRRGACRPIDSPGGFSCIYHFLAPTDSLRAAESYTVRDLAWAGMKRSGKIEFDPSFTALTLVASTTVSAPNPNAPSDSAQTASANSTPKAPNPTPPALSPVYTVAGNDLMQLWPIDKWGCRNRGRNCLEVYQGLTPVPLSRRNFQVASKTTAILSIDPPLPAPLIAVEATACPAPKSSSALAPKPVSPPPAQKPAAPVPAPGSAPVPSTSGATSATTLVKPPPAPVSPKPAKASSAPTCNNPSDQIAIVDANSSATILYTTDGLPPDRTLVNPDTFVYDKQFKVQPDPKTKRENIQAIAILPGQVFSEASSAVVVPTSDQIKKTGKGARQASYKAIPMSLATSGQLSYKSYRFVWRPVFGEPVEWDLAVPQATPAPVTASAILNESDSTEITFSNINIQPTTASNPITFLFDGQPVQNAVFKYDPVGMTMKVLITSVMTAKPGHKELLLNGYTLAEGSVTPSPVQIELPFDVTKR